MLFIYMYSARLRDGYTSLRDSMGILCEEVQGERVVGGVDGDTANCCGGVSNDNFVFTGMPVFYSRPKPIVQSIVDIAHYFPFITYTIVGTC